MRAAQNNHINDAVEAAVMKYVGPWVVMILKEKHDADDYAFAQWTGFLDDNMNEASSDAVAPSSTPPKKKEKKDKKKDKEKRQREEERRQRKRRKKRKRKRKRIKG